MYLYIIIAFNFYNDPWIIAYYHPCFTDEETEAQKGWSCSRSHGWEVVHPGLSAGTSDPKVHIGFIMPHHLLALREITKVPLLSTYPINSPKQNLILL